MEFINTVIVKIVAENIAPSVAIPEVLNNTPTSIADVLRNAGNYLLWIVGIVGTVMMIYSGFMYITSAGNPQKTKLALQSILYTVAGFVVAIMAQSIVTLILPVANGVQDVGKIVSNGIALFMGVIGITAIIMIIVGGFLYVTSAGDPSKTKTAKDAILYAVIGLAVAILGSTIIAFINSTIGR